MTTTFRQVLVHMPNALCRSGNIALVVLAASSCVEPQHSDAFAHLNLLPRSEWVQFAGALPLEERLDLYDEVYRNSGHPKETSLADAFAKGGAQVLREVLLRITSKRDFDEYLRILYVLDQADWSVCERPAIGEIRSVARRVGIELSNGRMINFGRCHLYDWLDSTSIVE